MTRIFLWIFVLIVCVKSLFEDNLYVTHASITDMKNESENPDYMVMTLIYESSNPGSIALERVLNEVMPKFKNNLKILALDCGLNSDVCGNELISKLPLFQGYVPAGLNPYTGKPLIHERPYAGIIASKEISEFFNNNIPYLGEYLTPENKESIMSEKLNKVFLFTNKDKVPLIYKGLSSKYRGRLEFAVVWHHQKDLVAEFDVTDFPSLIVIENDEIIKYTSKIDFDQISEFLSKYASATRKPLTLKKQFTSKPPTQEETKLPEFPVVTLSLENYSKYLQEDPGVFLVHFYKDKLSTEWEDIKRDYNGIVKLANFHCATKEDLEVCQSLGVKKYPSIRLFPVNKKRKSFELSFNNRADLEEELSRELKHDVINLKEATLATFFSTIQEEKKVAVMLLSDDPIPLHFKGIASEASFKDYAKFAYFSISREKVVSMIRVTKFPVILSLTRQEDTEKMQVVEYNGAFDDYRSLYYFVDQIAIQLLQTKKPKISEEDQQEIDEVQDTNSFNTKCLKRSGICVIGFFEGSVKNIQAQASSSYKVLKNVKALIDKKNLPVSFITVDGLCQYELRESFGISEIALPNIAVYVNSKKKGARLVGTFNLDDITGFIEGALRGKISTNDITSLSYIERNCEQLTPTNESAEDDEILQEVLKQSQPKGFTQKSSDTKRGRKKKSTKKSNDL
jgi:Thioredoxin